VVALLARRKAELCELLEVRLDALARFQRVGDLAGPRRKRRVVRTFEKGLGSIDRVARTTSSARMVHAATHDVNRLAAATLTSGHRKRVRSLPIGFGGMR
jgi:hypothetical protein